MVSLRRQTGGRRVERITHAVERFRGFLAPIAAGTGAVLTGRDPVRRQRRLGDEFARLARGLALWKFEMHGTVRRGGGIDKLART